MISLKDQVEFIQVWRNYLKELDTLAIAIKNPLVYERFKAARAELDQCILLTACGNKPKLSLVKD